MDDITIYELLGISKERARTIARAVRESFSQSEGPGEWMRRLMDEFGIEPKNAEAFACGWFAGRYAGVSDVFKVVQKEMDEAEKEKWTRDSSHPPMDGYA